MAVAVDGDLDGGVTEAFLHDEKVCAFGNHQRGGGVPEVVLEPISAQSRPAPHVRRAVSTQARERTRSP